MGKIEPLGLKRTSLNSMFMVRVVGQTLFVGPRVARFFPSQETEDECASAEWGRTTEPSQWLVPVAVDCDCMPTLSSDDHHCFCMSALSVYRSKSIAPLDSGLVELLLYSTIAKIPGSYGRFHAVVTVLF